MTTTSDPREVRYLDEAETRDEMTRVFDVCQGCRRCVDLCPVFPTLFELIDRRDDRDAGWLTPAEQDLVAERCVQCKLCTIGCPYAPDLHESAVDVPRLMIRAAAMRRENGHVSAREKRALWALGRFDRIGRIAGATPVVRRVADARPGGVTRRLVALTTGVTAQRRLPRFAAERFSTWFRNRPPITMGKRQGSVTIFPTCIVDAQDTGTGRDLVKVYERNGIECTIADVGCCGAPSLHGGDIRRFEKIAERNVARLAAAIRAGTDIVVPQPTCGYVVTQDYPRHVAAASRADAELVAGRTFDVSEFLMRVHRGDGTILDTDFRGTTSRRVVYHSSGPIRARRVGDPGRDLLRVTGADVVPVVRCSGLGGPWGLRADSDEVAIEMAEELAARIDATPDVPVAGDCHLANTVIHDHTGRRAVHPVRVVARAYGFPEEDH